LSLYSIIKLPDGTEGYVEINSSIDAMKDSINAASNFILYLSLVVTIIGTIAIFYVSRKISKPIEKIGFVFQKFNLISKYTALYNVALSKIRERRLKNIPIKIVKKLRVRFSWPKKSRRTVPLVKN
jgi:ABC-type polar amino acid transport system ATPase subunit